MARNVNYRVDKNKLVIEVDIGDKARETAKPSATGKTKLVGSTEGALPIPGVDGMTFSLNVMAK